VRFVVEGGNGVEYRNGLISLGAMGERRVPHPLDSKGAGFFLPMRNRLKGYCGLGHLHFITFSCYERRPLLGRPHARNLFVKVLGEVREAHGFLLVGYVVMPDHVHLLIGEPRRGTVSTAWQVLKQRVSRSTVGKRRPELEHQRELQIPGPTQEAPRFWQRRFYDFNVWSWRKRKEKLEDMHSKPVKRGLVDDPKDCSWSSWSFSAKGELGLVRIDPVD
jgi:putative transposase